MLGVVLRRLDNVGGAHQPTFAAPHMLRTGATMMEVRRARKALGVIPR